MRIMRWPRMRPVYEDLESEMYGDVMSHYRQMKDVYERIRGVFHA